MQESLKNAEKQKMPWENKNLPFSSVVPRLASIVFGGVDKSKVQKIYLFGSYAYGTPDEDSDLDICVILDNQEKYHSYYVDIACSLLDKNIIKKDLLVYHENEFYGSKNPRSIENTIIEKGVLLYERKRSN
jgi:predicted nucleotidyltransferase